MENFIFCVVDMISQDEMYHLSCLLALYQKTQEKQAYDKVIDDDRSLQGTAGELWREPLSYMEQTADKNKCSVFKMTDLATLHKTTITDLVGKSPYPTESTP